jgi:dolichol-phosphate mannosyltransferase
VHDWAARLIPALAGIGAVAITAGWAWRTLGFWPALVSGTILALSSRFLYLAGMVSMDGLLCVFVLAGLAAGHLALTDFACRRRWLVLSSLACALGILTKGPVAFLLIVIPLMIQAFLDRRCRFVTKVEACVYLGIVAMVAGPWFILMYWQAPGAAGSFLWLHNVMRYLAPVDHEKPAWFYVPSLLLGMLPWTLLLVPMLSYLAGRSLRMGQRRPMALGAFVLGFAWCVLFFSLSGCKRPAYILPAFPLLALMLGTFVTHGLPWQRWMHAWRDRPSPVHRFGQRWVQWLTATTALMGLALSVAAAVTGLATVLEAILAAGFVGVIGALVLFTPARLPAWTSWSGCVLTVFFVLLLAQTAWLPDYHQRFGLRRQVEISAAFEQEEELPIVSYPKRYDSIPFYTKRTDFDSYTPADFAQLMHDLSKHGKALVFVRREGALRELQAALPQHLEVEVLDRQNAFVAVCLVKPRRR